MLHSLSRVCHLSADWIAKEIADVDFQINNFDAEPTYNKERIQMSSDHEVSNKPDGAFRILHTADWHLGKLLNDQSRHQEHQRFLDWLYRVVKGHSIDAIILAGDVFDSPNPPQQAVRLYYDFVASLSSLDQCEFVVIAGNHDSAAHLESPKQVLSALHTHVIGFLPEDPADRLIYLPDSKDPRVAIATLPFLRDKDVRVGKAGEDTKQIGAKVVAGIQLRYQETADAANLGPNCPVIGTGHLTVLGSKTSDSERDIHIGGLGSVNPGIFPKIFSYVALGHLHRPQAPKGDDRIHYSGSPIALSFSESEDTKEVRIIDLVDDQLSQHQLPIPCFRHLAQIRTTSDALEKSIEEFTPDPGEFKAWVEVVVSEATFDEDLIERVQLAAKDRDFDVLKVIRSSTHELQGMSVEQQTDDEAIESLLDDPSGVFRHLLEEKGIQGTEAEELSEAFAILLDLDSQDDFKSGGEE